MYFVIIVYSIQLKYNNCIQYTPCSLQIETNSNLPMNESRVDRNSSLHVCPDCGKSFTRQSYLSCHMIAHRSPALECDACHRQFGRVDSLRRHRCPAASNSKSLCTDSNATPVAVRPRHMCPNCEKTYSRRETLLQHVVRHHQDLLDDNSGQRKAIEAHPCSVCRRVFASTLSLHNHEVLVHGGTALADSVGFSCGGCGRQFASQLNVDRHLCPNAPQQQGELMMCRQKQTTSSRTGDTKSRAVDINSHLCDVDDETTLPQRSVAEAVVPVKRCKCQFCGRTFSGSGWLHRHVAAAHADQVPMQSCDEVSSIVDQSVSGSQASRGHVCPVCGKSLSSVSNLNKHLLTHGPRRETCPECGRQYHQQATLRQHVRDVHAPPGSYAVECQMCGLRMRSRNSLYSHIARFHPPSSSSVPRHMCGICGRSFYQRGNLRKHEKTHQDHAPYVCPECPCRLRSAERLRRHQTWHKHGAQFPCADCRRCFVQPSDLRRHIAFRHSSTNSTYRCCYCGVCCRHYQVCYITLHMFSARPIQQPGPARQ